MNKPLPPLGTHRLEITALHLGVTRNDNSWVTFEFRALSSDTPEVRAGDEFGIPFVCHEMEIINENGERCMVMTSYGQWAMSRAKALVIAAVDGVVDPPGEWDQLDPDTERVEDALRRMADGQRHVVDVDVTERPAQGRRPGMVRLFAWSSVMHLMADPGCSPEVLP